MREKPVIREQDVDRFAKSAQVAEDRHRERSDQLGKLEAKPESSGALGLEERLAGQESELAAKERRSSVSVSALKDWRCF